MKADEFRSLRQGAMTVNQYIRKFMKLARYAPEDVNTDKKKQDRSRKGLSNHLKAQLITHIYPDFNTLMNRTTLLEDARSHIETERKRKFLARPNQQERFQIYRTNSFPRPGNTQRPRHLRGLDTSRLCSTRFQEVIHKPQLLHIQVRAI